MIESIVATERSPSGSSSIRSGGMREHSCGESRDP